MDELIFPEPDRKKTLKQIKQLPIVGRALRTQRNLACVSCGRSTLPVGRLPWVGAPLCRHEDCEYTSVAQVSELFPTPYGRAISTPILRIFCRVLEKNRVLVQRKPILERAEILVDGYIDLLNWQHTYHTYDRLTNPSEYDLGCVSLIPPRRLDDVLVFRAIELPVAIDPTQNLDPSIHQILHRVRKEGSSALNVPF